MAQITRIPKDAKRLVIFLFKTREKFPSDHGSLMAQNNQNTQGCQKISDFPFQDPRKISLRSRITKIFKIINPINICDFEKIECFSILGRW